MTCQITANSVALLIHLKKHPNQRWTDLMRAFPGTSRRTIEYQINHLQKRGYIQATEVYLKRRGIIQRGVRKIKLYSLPETVMPQ